MSVPFSFLSVPFLILSVPNFKMAVPNLALRRGNLATGAVSPDPHFADTTRRDFDARAWHSPVTVGHQDHVGSAK